jgi:hypothetical protein
MYCLTAPLATARSKPFSDAARTRTRTSPLTRVWDRQVVKRGRRPVIVDRHGPHRCSSFLQRYLRPSRDGAQAYAARRSCARIAVFARGEAWRGLKNETARAAPSGRITCCGVPPKTRQSWQSDEPSRLNTGAISFPQEHVIESPPSSTVQAERWRIGCDASSRSTAICPPCQRNSGDPR